MENSYYICSGPRQSRSLLQRSVCKVENVYVAQEVLQTRKHKPRALQNDISHDSLTFSS